MVSLPGRSIIAETVGSRSKPLLWSRGEGTKTNKDAEINTDMDKNVDTHEDAGIRRDICKHLPSPRLSSTQIWGPEGLQYPKQLVPGSPLGGK